MYYMRIMRLILIITIVLLSSCSSKYKGAHTDYKKFKKDIEYCLQKSCIYKTKKVLDNLSIISSALAYGGGSGSSFQQNKISNATNRPSPVVANLPNIIWPDCSPPRLKLFFFIISLTYLSPTFDLLKLIFSFTKNFSKP